MRRHRAAGGGLGLLLAILLCAAPAAALDAIYLVRHAEKSEGWPQDSKIDEYWPLSAAGQVRAEFLASRLENAGIAAVYTTRTTRTLMTGLPLARRINVPISADDDSKNNVEAVLSGLRGKHPGDKAVLIVGHSNTIPLLLLRLGATPDCFERLGIVQKGPTFLIEGYDGLWKIDLKEQGCEALVRE
jgi:broad specificity phosphatase PhoE